MRTALAAAACTATLAAMAAHAADRPRVENFSLPDHRGDTHELYHYADAPAIVLIVHGNGCPIVRNALADYRAISDAYMPKNVVFLMLNANLQDRRATIAAEADEWDIPYRILIDDSQHVAVSLGITRTAEVLVIDPDSWEIAYRGPVNDRLSYGQQKQAAAAHYLRDALDAIIEGTDVTVASRDAIGCLINLSDAKAARTAPALGEN